MIRRPLGEPLDVRQRRRAIEERLEAAGLLRGPRRTTVTNPEPPTAEERVVRLAAFLATEGPVFAAFGRYLGSRLDLLPVVDCLQLAEIPDRAVPMSVGAWDERLAAELGRAPGELFTTRESEPWESRLFFQAHRARLTTGETVVVRLLRPEIEEATARDLEHLPLLARTFPESAAALPIAEVVADFRRHLEAQLDLGHQAESLLFLGRDQPHGDLLVVPKVFPELTGSGVLTLEWLPGTPLEEVAGNRLADFDGYDLARRICLAWLRSALVERTFPIEAEVTELADGRLAFTGGVFASLPAASQVNLWDYLRYTGAHFPDRATGCLIKEMTRTRRAAAEGELRSRLRQVMPFRDGGWTKSGESLAEYALLHWRWARAGGFQPRPHLVSFYRGLYWAARTARRFAPEADPMQEALDDLQWLAGWNQFRQIATPRQLGAAAESYFAGLLELPQKVDQLLQIAESAAGFRVRVVEPAARRRRKNATTAVTTLGLLTAAFALMAQQWTALWQASGVSAVWSERLSTLTFLLLGGLLLRAIWRLGR